MYKTRKKKFLKKGFRFQFLEKNENSQKNENEQSKNSCKQIIK